MISALWNLWRFSYRLIHDKNFVNIPWVFENSINSPVEEYEIICINVYV